uniref:Solute carrier family 25 member 44 n=1 Tax=Cajanus cajan TaxID=3821 RepID=A0A151RG59_CAJCA|nr:Solute carrier family 25 member 44 [Cajanus cajan]
MMEPFTLSETTQAAIANGIAGMGSAFLSQLLFVPVDVVSQKLMVQGFSGHAQYSGGLDVTRKLIRSDGIKGLYRGFGLSVMTYTPSSAVWWASYGSSQRYIWSEVGTPSLPKSEVGIPSLPKSEASIPSLPEIIFVQATGGIIAAATASCFTTPLDTIKTRLQVTALEKKISVKQVVKDLIREDGWKGLYRGLGPRFFSMSAWGTSMILAYEYLKRLCAKDEEAIDR